ncbi:16S rRNA (cytosine(1407)-C(5))-methyltransferase RsmF [Paraferrimonas haliotis]|uniref:Ribosomal RNA small subunit methyltransferase F n=1 Tax=Paraferrimonas haliotis TaxID=2013866 RepID=A0AA37TXE9_9GAMM|nr:16S rRNA (cytosine(1407)-C(5))-methyltransferase RsmF [Paraferrimonas haliotis]GLS84639.1 ribosomal RNA small subunit methyltransferase F [Paraferrimonas haliotis]
MVATSLNPEFLDSIEKILPSELSIDDFIDYSQRPLRRSIRVNTLAISVTDFVKRMQAQGWQLQAIPWCEQGFWVGPEDKLDAIGNTVEHLAGLFYIQEASSMLPVTALFQSQRQPMMVLDMAAAPGSKTTQIAAQMNNQGLLVANEYSASRIKSLFANCQRLGIRNVALTHFSANVFGQYLPETFDSILLDAPCGGEGTIRKDPRALDNWSQAAIDEISALQRELIESAFQSLKVGGELVYSTCTLNEQENHQVCHHLKQRFADAVEFVPLDGLFDGCDKALTEEGFLHVWPQLYDSEGFFIAKIRKTKAVDSKEARKAKIAKFPFQAATQKQRATLQQQLQPFNLAIPDSAAIYYRDGDYWWFPTEFEALIGKMRFSRAGIRVASEHKKGLNLHHDAAKALFNRNAQAIELDVNDAGAFLMGRDVEQKNSADKGEKLVSYQGTTLGIVKALGKRLKNRLPRELVRDKISNSNFSE